jgi:hypothetical protein
MPSRNFHGPASASQKMMPTSNTALDGSHVSCDESQHLNHVVQRKTQQHLRSLRTRSTRPMNGVSAGLVQLTNSKPRDPALQYSAHAPARSREVRHREDGSGLVGGGWAFGNDTLGMITSDITFRDRSFAEVQRATFVIEREIVARVHVRLL